MARKFDLELDESILESLWIDDYADNIEIVREVLGIARDLASRYSIGIISNTIVEHSTILRSLGVFDDFHDIILSHDERMTKDNPALFDVALKRLGVDAIEAIFVDDLPRFADVAASRGIQTVLFENATRLREALSNLGVELNV